MLTIGVVNTPTSLDPGQTFGLETVAIMNLAYGTLTSLDPDGYDVSMGLAESAEPSGKTSFVVKLRPNLTFSDDSPLTATDVVASFDHYMADETNGWGYTFTPIEEVTAADDLTVVFDLKQPYPSLPFVLSAPYSAILPSEAIEERGSKGLYEDPLPTAGQFQIESFEQNQITLQANPNYLGGEPSTKTLVFRQISDSAARAAQLQGSEIDFAYEISPKQVEQFSDPVEAHTTYSAIGGIYLSMNNRDNSVLSDVRIRQAIALAIDRNQINEVAWAGQSQPLGGLWGNPSTYNDNFLPVDPDVEGAKELLAGTACATGCTLRLVARGDNEPFSDTTLVIQQNLEAIGIQADIQRAESSAIEEMVTEGNFDLSIERDVDWGDWPDGFLDFGLGSTFGALYSGYSSPEMDQLIQQIKTSSGSARDATADRISALFEEDLPFAPLVDFAVVSASRVPSETFDVDPSLYFHVD